MTRFEQIIFHLEMMGYIVESEFYRKRIQISLLTQSGKLYFVTANRDDLLEDFCIEKIVRRINEQIKNDLAN